VDGRDGGWEVVLVKTQRRSGREVRGRESAKMNKEKHRKKKKEEKKLDRKSGKKYAKRKS